MKDKTIVKKIIAAANLKSSDFILEIGPGKGILTEELAKKAGRVIAVELDAELADFLKEKFRKNEKIEIVKGDILKTNLYEVIARLKAPEKKYKVVANLPYYITSPIIRMFLEAEFPPSEMVLMVQKEVAERICAKPGKMSILAVAVQYYADAEILFNVGKGNFDPIPEVDSCVIKINPHPNPLPKGEGDFDKKFFRVVRAGFCAKRKTLANNLTNSFHLPKKEAEEKIKAVGILPTARAQELSVENWKVLTKYL